MAEYWFNVRTHTVETDATRSQEKEVMGPYATYEEAARALETAAARTEAWDEEERRWNEGEGDA